MAPIGETRQGSLKLPKIVDGVKMQHEEDKLRKGTKKEQYIQKALDNLQMYIIQLETVVEELRMEIKGLKEK